MMFMYGETNKFVMNNQVLDIEAIMGKTVL